MILRAEEAAILPYCNDDKRESAEKMRLRRVRFIFVNLNCNGDFLVKLFVFVINKLEAIHREIVEVRNTFIYDKLGRFVARLF